ncbi:hypothetical protein G3A43_08230 [Paraburkholderia aspalathi]|nr:hypothetical protein [Paraburkholderia aspalathi]MBK3780243.1 hypothetical protein [Paraburkholderia aspalathi]
MSEPTHLQLQGIRRAAAQTSTTAAGGSPCARLRRRNRFILTGDAMHAVAADRPPMGPGFSRKLLKRAASLDVGGNYEGRAFFTLRGNAGELLGEVDFAPADFLVASRDTGQQGFRTGSRLT